MSDQTVSRPLKHSPQHNAARRLACNKYEKTKNGFLMRLYRNMKSRIEGVQWQKHHLYAGKYLLPRDEFYEWALASPKFHELFAAYEASGYERRLAPSADRVDSALGYETDNLEWTTHSENSRRGCHSKHRQAGHRTMRQIHELVSSQ